MHTFLRSIGFSDDKLTEYDVEELLDDISGHYDHMESVLEDSRAASYLELTRSVGPDLGIKVCGEMDGRGFHRTTYYPALRGKGITSGESIAIQRGSDGASYLGTCEDGRCAAPIIFHVQNPGDYRREMKLGRLDSALMETTFSALALSGMIILPVETDEAGKKEREDWHARRAEVGSAA